MDGTQADIVIIGAGLSGIAAARFYLEVHPSCNLVILERDTCVGGAWNARRSYEGFWTQWSIGLGEFSDKSMEKPPPEDTFYRFFKAKHTTNYLERYVNEHIYNGHSLRDRVRFSFDVKNVERSGEQWRISGRQNGHTISFTAPKLIVSSGLTSIPNIPHLKNAKSFNGPIIHQESFGQSDTLTAKNIKHVAVLGGGKSAADMVYACVKAGKQVTWIIRKSGSGPGFLVPPKGKANYNNVFELGATRAASTMSPSIYSSDTYWNRFMHGTTWGRSLVHSLWSSVDAETRDQAGYKSREGANESFKKLAPHTPIFWGNATGGLLNRDDFFELVARHVHVFIEDIEELRNHAVVLSDGTNITADAILCGTGWKSSITFMSNELRAELQVPHDILDEDPDDAKEWAELETAAEQDILQRFQYLKSPPAHRLTPSSTTPYRLYKNIAPINDANSIAFIGFTVYSNYFRGTESQAVWATAYLDGKLQLPSLEEQKSEVAQMVAFCRKRYLSLGRKGNFLPFESTIYCDNLLEQIGLQSHRKGWFHDYFVPSPASDMRDIKDEYIAKFYHDQQSEKDKSV